MPIMRPSLLNPQQRAIFDYVLGDYKTLLEVLTTLINQTPEVQDALIDQAIAAHISSLENAIYARASRTEAPTLTDADETPTSAAGRPLLMDEPSFAIAATPVQALPKSIEALFSSPKRKLPGLIDAKFWADLKEYYKRVLSFPYQERDLIKALSIVAKINFIEEQRKHVLDEKSYDLYLVPSKTTPAGFDPTTRIRINAALMQEQQAYITDMNAMLRPARRYSNILDFTLRNIAQLFYLIAFGPTFYDLSQLLQGKPKYFGWNSTIAIFVLSYVLQYLLIHAVRGLVYRAVEQQQTLEAHLHQEKQAMLEAIQFKPVKLIRAGGEVHAHAALPELPPAPALPAYVHPVSPPVINRNRRVPVGKVRGAPAAAEEAAAPIADIPHNTAIVFGEGLIYDPAHSDPNIIQVRGRPGLYAHLDHAALERTGLSNHEIAQFQAAMEEGRFLGAKSKGERGIKAVKEGRFIEASGGRLVPASAKIKLAGTGGAKGARVFGHTLLDGKGNQLLEFNTYASAKEAHTPGR